MCLRFNQIGSSETKTLTFYKVFRRWSDQRVTPPIHQILIPDNSEVLDSGRGGITPNERKHGVIDKAIHVFAYEGDAQNFATCYEFVWPVTVKAEDVIARNIKEVACQRVTFGKGFWDYVHEDC